MSEDLTIISGQKSEKYESLIPQSIDDSVARRDWNWKEEYDLAAMTKDMLENLPKMS